MSLPNKGKLQIRFREKKMHFISYISQKLYPKDRFKNLFMVYIFNDVF